MNQLVQLSIPFRFPYSSRVSGRTFPLQRILKHTLKRAELLGCVLTAATAGMLTASLFSAIIGSAVPGSVYLDQKLKFKAPVMVDTQVPRRLIYLIILIIDFPRAHCAINHVCMCVTHSFAAIWLYRFSVHYSLCIG